MKINKALVGRVVEVEWMDPIGLRIACRHMDLPKGLGALAVWHEFGRLDDVTDGVLRILHSHADSPPLPASDDKPEFQVTWIPEVLVRNVKVYKEDIESGEASRQPTIP